MTEFRMPSLGADMESGFLREWHVKPGDTVKRGDIIAEVETQKGIIDIEVFDEGIVGDLFIKIDETVPVGTLMTHILTLDEAKAGLKPEVPAREEQATAVAAIPDGKPSVQAAPVVHRVRASPLARRIAQQHGIDLSQLKGSGPEGAITKDDMEKMLATRVTAGKPLERTAAQNVRMAVAAAMSKSNREIPHYYLQTKVDMAHALGWLAETNKQRQVKDRLLPAVLLIKAVARALEEVPDLNAWWEDGLQLKKDIHIGFVVSIRQGGIVVPAIHDVGKKNLDELMKALSDIIPRARALRLRSSELSDSTVTITNLGEGGVETVFGMIYPPQVALVGFGGIIQEAWAENGMLGIRPVLTASLSADHRASDGSTGSRFLTALKNHLKNPGQL